MPTTGAQGLIERMLHQLENSERLLLRLPKRYFQEKEDRVKLEGIARQIINIRDETDKTLKDIENKIARRTQEL